MRHLSPNEFHEYLVNHDECFFFNPRVNLAFRCSDKDGGTNYFCKSEGRPEKEIRYDDEDFNESWLFSTVLTKEEYERF